jgi:drug/metabolite transporter (DMT)-like permease
VRNGERQNSRIGLVLGFSAYSTFAVQDGLTKILLASFSPFQLAMLRFWGFLILALFLCARVSGRISLVTQFPRLQLLRGPLLAGHIMLGTIAFQKAGLLQTQSIFASGPIMVASLGIFFLGERLTSGRLAIILLGMAGVLIVIKPGGSTFDERLVWPLASVCLMALYAVLTRLTSLRDGTVTNTLYAAIGGLITTSLVGPFFWVNPDGSEFALLIALVTIGALSQWLLLTAYERAEAAAVQSLSFFHLLLGSIIGVIVFGEDFTANLALGGTIIVVAGILMSWEARRQM